MLAENNIRENRMSFSTALANVVFFSFLYISDI